MATQVGHATERKTRLGAPGGATVPRGQALVEFTLILPVLLLLLLGIIELGRMFFVIIEAASASREASRYGASAGLSEAGIRRFLDCDGMRRAAQRVVVLSDLPDSRINIAWDHGSVDQTVATCAAPPSAAEIRLGDRVVVSVSIEYRPLVPIVALPSFPVNFSTARTILMDIAAGPTPTAGGLTFTETPTTPRSPTPVETSTPGPTPTGPTPTVTQTPEPGSTEIPTATATLAPTATPIPAPGNFSVQATCSNGSLRFTWSAVTGAHYYAVYEVSSPPPDVQVCLTNKLRCDYSAIQLDGVTHTYYVVAYIHSRPSLPSGVQSVGCSPPG